MGVIKQLSWLGNTIKASAVIPAQVDFTEADFLDSGFRRSDDDFSHSLAGWYP